MGLSITGGMKAMVQRGWASLGPAAGWGAGAGSLQEKKNEYWDGVAEQADPIGMGFLLAPAVQLSPVK